MKIMCCVLESTESAVQWPFLLDLFSDVLVKGFLKRRKWGDFGETVKIISRKYSNKTDRNITFYSIR